MKKLELSAQIVCGMIVYRKEFCKVFRKLKIVFVGYSRNVSDRSKEHFDASGKR